MEARGDPGKAMTFEELIGRLDELDDELTLYASGGWRATAASPAVAALEPQDGSLPAEADGMEYLLEVAIAREVVEVWSAWRDGREPTTADKCEAILHYARHDAYLPT